MKTKSILLLPTLLTLLIPAKAFAHCPLCTGGAGAVAVAAAYLGVRHGALGVVLGGFSIALALWLAHKPKKDYVAHQSKILFWGIYLTTIIPFYVMFKGDYTSFYLSLGGDYGDITNRTYLIDMFIPGAILGSLAIVFAPALSSWITKQRGGSTIKFQGLAISFALMLILGAIMQVWPR